jgi:26S proteasome regulatory subunit T5
LLARACANQTNAVFLKLAGPQLVQMFIGDGAKLIRDAFDLAKAKIKAGTSAGAILFIDEIDAIGTKRFGGDQSGDREVRETTGLSTSRRSPLVLYAYLFSPLNLGPTNDA